MPDCNIRNVDAEMIRSWKVEAARQGQTLKDWIVWVLAANVSTEPSAVDPALLPAMLDRVAHVSSPESLSAKKQRALEALASVGSRAHIGASVPQPVDNPELNNTPACPDCGSAMAWNLVRTRWQCSCGYFGKKVRA